MIETSDAQSGFPPMSNAIHVYVNDVDKVYQTALQAGATSLYGPVDQDYGDREAGVKDAFGNHWYIGTRTKDISK
jgi:PhnB protein